MSGVPAVGAWVIYRDYSIAIRQIDKITDKLFKFGAGDSCPRQINRDDRRIIGFAPDHDAAKRLRDSIAGCDGEYKRRANAARADYTARCNVAAEARDKAVAALLAAEQPA